MRILLTFILTFSLSLSATAKPTWSESTPEKVVVIIPEGEKLSLEQEKQIVKAHKSGADIEGFVLSKDLFEERAAEILKNVKSEHHIFAKNTLANLSYENLRFQMLGLSKSVSYKEHLKKIGAINKDQVKTFAEATFVSGVVLALSAQSLQADYPHIDVNLAMPLFTLTAWIATYLAGIEGISSFRSQGKSIKINAKAPAGQQVSVRNNAAFLAANLLVLDIVLNAFLMGAFFLHNVPSELVVLGLTNAALTTFAKIPFELFVSDRLELAHRTQDPAEKRNLKKSALNYERIASNAVIPVLKLTHLFAGGAVVSNSVDINAVVSKASAIASHPIMSYTADYGLVVAGLVGFTFYIFKNNKWQPNPTSVAMTPQSCAIIF